MTITMTYHQNSKGDQNEFLEAPEATEKRVVVKAQDEDEKDRSSSNEEEDRRTCRDKKIANVCLYQKRTKNLKSYLRKNKTIINIVAS